MSRAGFTLLEMAVVLALMGFLMVGLQQGLHFGMTMRERSDAARDAISGLDAADRAIRRLIEQIEPNESGEAGDFTGTPLLLRCITELPSSAALAGSRIRATLGVDARHRLVLRWSAWPHVRVLSPEPEEETLILPDVDHIVIRYAADASGQRWLPVWDKGGVPPLIRVGLVFPPGDARSWPGIIAAPRRTGGP